MAWMALHIPAVVVVSVVHKLLSFSFRHPVHSVTPQLSLEQGLPLIAVVVPLPANHSKLVLKFLWSDEHFNF